MHEVSIATNILKIAEEELRKNQGDTINSIHLEVGRLSGVVVESLRFALEVTSKESVLKNTDIKIDELSAKAKCRSCHHEFEADDFYTICPVCHEVEVDFLSGKELLIKSMVIS